MAKSSAPPSSGGPSLEGQEAVIQMFGFYLILIRLWLSVAWSPLVQDRDGELKAPEFTALHLLCQRAPESSWTEVRFVSLLELTPAVAALAHEVPQDMSPSQCSERGITARILLTRPLLPQLVLRQLALLTPLQDLSSYSSCRHSCPLLAPG